LIIFLFMEIIKKLYTQHKHFVNYSLIWCTWVILDFCVYYILVNKFYVNYQLANFISISCGIINNFFLNLFFNFKTKNRFVLRFISFYIVWLIGIWVSALLLNLLIEIWWFDKNISKVLTIIVIVILQYGLNKHISFKK
jgi:putative flippase GtrA